MKIILAALLISGLIGCTETSDKQPDWPWQGQEPEQEVPETPEGATLDKWSDVSADFDVLPEYIRVFRTMGYMEHQ